VIVGATFKKDEINYWKSRVPVNMMMRIFPNDDGMMPDWSDSRFTYCRDYGVIPFISTKVDGNAAQLATLKARLLAMPSWVKLLYLTDRHEPEGDLSAAKYKANFNKQLAMVDSLPASLRARIRCGPVLTRQAVENKKIETPTADLEDNPTGGVYSTYDPGTGDFLGNDFYHNSWGSGSNAVTTPVPAATILKRFRDYKYSPTDKRPRIFPELGLIGFPTDSDGSKRAAWLNDMYNELRKWNTATVGWEFIGFVWWCAEGKSGNSVNGIGKKRWFQFDRRHNGKPIQVGVDTKGTPSTADDEPIYDMQGNYDIISGSKVTPAFNALAKANAGNVVTPPPVVDPDPEPIDPDDPGDPGSGEEPVEPDPDPEAPDPGDPDPVPDPGTLPLPAPLPADHGTPWSPRAYAAGPEFTVLVTGPNLRAVTAPVYDWSSLECTLKFNAVGGGTFTCPARENLIAAVGRPNNRVTIVRNAQPALGIRGEILISGPIERGGSFTWSADSDTEGGLGQLTVGFASNELYVAERLTYPNPAVVSTAQGTDYFTRAATNAELVMRELVNLNAGPGALADRRVPLLALGDAAGVGGPVDVTTRFDALQDVLRYLAVMGGHLGWRVRDTGAALLFEVYAPRTRLAAHFGRERGNVRKVAVDPSAPTATVAIAGGTGSGASRLIVERTSADRTLNGWRRMETFVNQNGVVTTGGLQQYADADLEAKKATTAIAIEPTDPFGGGYGLKYRLGDIVPAGLPTGGRVLDIVTAVTVKANAGQGATFTPTIGPRRKTSDDQFIRDMQARLSRMERG
jgi:hypothetical protein